jgi:hypothetical protein
MRRSRRRRRRSRKTVVGVALVAGCRHAASGRRVYRVAIEAVGQHADRDAAAGQRRIGRAHDVAALNEVALGATAARRCGIAARKDSTSSRAPRPLRSGLRATSRRRRSKTAPACSKTERNERRLELLRIAARHGIDEDLGCGARSMPAGNAPRDSSRANPRARDRAARSAARRDNSASAASSLRDARARELRRAAAAEAYKCRVPATVAVPLCKLNGRRT